ncbi:zinc finger protein 710a isoform X1 [Syngnathus acus]|uniref:zinc finger protein 710a isoform X1 n=2 Tax=Syngnathus acus TaxID=161584 RepID=UPI001886421D|nr:zinc finger protein 710a isoform X1 [Syngnathus acus]
MRSLKQLKHHSENNVDQEIGRTPRPYPKLSRGQMDAGTQTEPVVVLSLAQAAVLGLISQNEIFGATIAPNGFYTGESKEGPPLATEYHECADQLIGANGDYLPEPAGDPASRLSAGERRRPCPRGAKRPRSDGEPAASPHARVKGELIESETSPDCVDVSDGSCARAMRGDPKSSVKEPACGNGPSCVREASLPQEQSVDGEEEDSLVGEEPEEEALNLKTGGGSGKDDPYLEANQAPFQSAYEESGQAALWSDPEGLARRMQMDRLDINVQIDESYCVDVGEGLKRWKCRMCDKSYTSKYNLVTHILGHNGIKPHECSRCGKLFKQPSHLQTHLLTHQGTRPHKCAVCDKAFTQTSHLKRHMLQHTDVKPYSCRFCARGFAYPSELRTHEGKHQNGQCHACRRCGVDFPTYGHLKRHLGSHQGPAASAAAYQCGQCHKSFAYRSQLQNHSMKHQNVRPYVCPECGVEFVQIHHLRQHALTHKGTKEFKCEVCSREFTLSANLKRHMLIHASVRPFQCHVCFKTFVQKQTLKTHMIVHLPVKPFKCKVCAKSFNRMYNLLGHMHLHAGSKPFKCPYCSSKFNLKGNLSRHMKVKHGIADGIAAEGRGTPLSWAKSGLGPGPGPPRDTEGREDYEEGRFDFGEPENRADGTDAADTPKLSPLDYYGTYGTGAGRCGNA